MKIPLLFLLSLLTLSAHAAPVSLFNGKTFEGWEGDTEKTWRIEEGGVIAAGKLEEKAPRNEFLATKKSFKDFELRLKFKLQGTEGFVNSGVQIRSVRISNPPNEMMGYQADLGDPKYWGALYDESRRKKMLAEPDMAAVNKVLKRNDWNDYRIRAEGPRVRIWINGVQTIDYTETDASLPQEGHIALQIHGNGKTEVRFRDIEVEELP